MKILFVSDVSIGSIIGGAERVLFEQAAGLCRRGHETHILTRRLPEHDRNPGVINGVKEWRYPVIRDGNLSFLITSTKNGRALFDDLNREHRFDVINFHQPVTAYAALRSPGSKKLTKIYTCHSLAFEEYRTRHPPPDTIPEKILYALQTLGLRWMEHRVLLASNHIVCLSKYTRKKLLNTHRTPEERIMVIPGGVDLSRFSPPKNRSNLRARLGLPKTGFLLFTVRNLVQRMGLDQLVMAMKSVVAHVSDIRFLIGGDGPLKPYLQNLVQETGLARHFTFCGYIPEDALPDYYRMADLFILPTRELEGFGLVTLEAMASGLPVLGTPVGGTTEILSKFDSELLFENTSSDAMADLIIKTHDKIKQNPDWYVDLSKRCRQFVEDNYSWERNVDALEELFIKMVADKPC